MAAGSLRSRELIDSVLARIDDLNPTINALVSVDGDGARAAAAIADAERRDGAPVCPLHGVPVTIKANLDVAGQPTSSGVAAFAEKIAGEDAPAVRNLKAAGAIVIGRSNMPEFGLRGTTFNPLFGRTTNPWHGDASPGGSSGGAGAAAAPGFGPPHQGSDIGGSLRFPAFGCGVASVKSTSFRVPAYNSFSSGERGVLSQTISCQGVLAPRVDDVRRGLSAMIAHAAPPPIEDAFRAWLRAATIELAVGLGPVLERFGSDDIRQLLQWTIDSGEVLGRKDYMTALGTRGRPARNRALPVRSRSAAGAW